MLKAGFIGFGRMGVTHLSILNTHPSVKIAAICDKSKTMLGILKKYLDVELYSDYEEMIAKADMDFVIVSTPVDSHSEVIKVAIENNLHTFTEKPFTLTSSAGKEILTLLEGKKLVNQVGYVNRFNEVFAQVKRLLNAGLIGELKHFSSEMYGATVLKDSKATWRGTRKSGGGCMYEFASHCIDLATYLIGEPEYAMGSVMQKIYSSDVEDLVSSTLKYKNGCNGYIMVNWSDETFRKPTNIFTISGTKGKIIADKHAYKIYLKQADHDNGFQKGWNTRYITDFAKSVRFYVRGNEFTSQLDYFVDCIEQERFENISSFAEALKTDIIMEKIAEDANRDLLSGERALHSSARFVDKTQPSIWKKFANFIVK